MATVFDWERLESIFHRVVETPEELREEFLRHECAGSELLHRELDSLLSAASDISGFLGRPQAVAALRSLAQAGDRTGEVLGGYDLEGKLGQGGTGVVYWARSISSATFPAEAAIKVFLPGVDSAAVLERFRREREILTNLQHPGIARVADAGLTEDGCPYLVMELVSGEPIDRYCERHMLSVNARARLFLEVCEALGYAHRRLVVHRDIKPSHVVVTPEGTIKLLDFGTAGFLGGKGPGGAPWDTEEPGWMVTPGYASPEQISGDATGTAADIFGLGVVLYEVLTGQHPFILPGLSSQEVLQRVRESDPVRPSSVVPERFHSSGSGDLDAIVLRALRKDPDSRYRSMEHFAADLRAYLESRPISARQGTWRYRTARFLRRNRVAVTAVLAVLVALVVAGALMLSKHRELQKETAKAEATTAFLLDLFTVPNPKEGRGETLTAQQLLGRGAVLLDTGLQDQPRLRASFHNTIGEVHFGLGSFAEGCAHLDRAETLLEALGSPVAKGRQWTRIGRCHLELGKLEEAEQALLQGREEFQRYPRRDVAMAGRNLLYLGNLYQMEARFEKAIEALREGLALLRDGGEETARARVAGFSRLAYALYLSGHETEALAPAERAVEIGRQMGPDSPYLADALEALGNVRIRHDRQRAAAAYRGALEIRKKVLGEDHPKLGDSYHNLGDLAWTQGAYLEAVGFFEKSLRLTIPHLGAHHPAVITSRKYLASVLLETGRVEEAEQQLTAALEAVRETLENHRDLYACELLLGQVRGWQGRVREAEVLLVGALKGAREAVPSPRHRYLGYRVALMDLWVREGRWQEVREERQRLAAELKSPPGAYHQARLDVFDARLAAHRGDHSAAEKLLAKVKAAEVYGVPHHPLTLESELAQASLDLLAGRPNLALRRAKVVMGHAERQVGSKSRLYLESELVLGTALAELERWHEALKVLEHATDHLPAGFDRPRMGGASAGEVLARVRRRLPAEPARVATGV